MKIPKRIALIIVSNKKKRSSFSRNAKSTKHSCLRHGFSQLCNLERPTPVAERKLSQVFKVVKRRNKLCELFAGMEPHMEIICSFPSSKIVGQQLRK